MAKVLFQGAAIVAPVSFESETVSYKTEALNLIQERITFPGQRFSFSFSVEQEGAPEVFLHLVENQGAPFTFTVPQLHFEEVELGTLTVDLTTAADAGSNLITFPSGIDLPKTRFVRFANHSKLYLVVGRPSSTTARLFPPLVQTVPEAGTLRYGDNVTAEVFYDASQLAGLSFNNGLLGSIDNIRVVEAL